MTTVVGSRHKNENSQPTCRYICKVISAGQFAQNLMGFGEGKLLVSLYSGLIRLQNTVCFLVTTAEELKNIMFPIHVINSWSIIGRVNEPLLHPEIQM
jgi:hypothetical protein